MDELHHGGVVMDERTEQPEERTLVSVVLPPELFAHVHELELQKETKKREALVLEELQQGLITGYFIGAKLGPFEPDKWQITEQGVMQLIDPPIELRVIDGPPQEPVAPAAD